MDSARKSKSGRANKACPGERLATCKILPNVANQALAEVSEIPRAVLNEIESQRGVLVTVITLLHCLHLMLEHRQDHIDEELKPCMAAAVRWTCLPEMTAMLLERTHEVLSALDPNNLSNVIKAFRP